MKKILLFLIVSLSAAVSFAQEENALVKGNEYYRQQQYDLAEKQYRLAVQQDPNNIRAQYNLANALYQQKKYDEAHDLFKKLQDDAPDKNIKEAAYYNNGVSYSKEKNLEESIEAYKGALRLDPNDQNARENLQKALLELKKKQKDQQDQQKEKSQSNMSQKEAERKLKLLQEKEKQLHERLQKNGQKGGSQQKDW